MQRVMNRKRPAQPRQDPVAVGIVNSDTEMILAVCLLADAGIEKIGNAENKIKEHISQILLALGRRQQEKSCKIRRYCGGGGQGRLECKRKTKQRDLRENDHE